MKEMTNEDVAMVEGGLLQFLAPAMGAYFLAGYNIGKDLAARDNAR
ncbi:class IIb bacteriocin, lactobin A/cerein 7B family [Stenotrophomonas maltophilia]|nr:class IIb bacteriocin, lactobin A/cerein 7B family [Stenotrophomonas maltophilia]